MDEKEIFIRLFLAIIIGGAIGYNREFENMPAGFRTHILVCVGATVAALIEVQLGYSIGAEILKNPNLSGVLKVDCGRVIAQVISGVGFLGAGTIIRNKGDIKGLTTAASIWAVACIGIAIGMGFYLISIISCLVVVVVLVFLKKFQIKFISAKKPFSFKVIYRNKDKVLEEINNMLSDEDIVIKEISYKNNIDGDFIIYEVDVPKNTDLNGIISDISSCDDVKKVVRLK